MQPEILNYRSIKRIWGHGHKRLFSFAALLTGWPLKTNWKRKPGTIWRPRPSHITAVGSTAIPVGPMSHGEEVILGHWLGGWVLEGTISPMHQEVALVAGGGSGPAWGPTKSNTCNYPAFTKTSSSWMMGENSKPLGLCSLEAFHMYEAASFHLKHYRQAGHSTEI